MATSNSGTSRSGSDDSLFDMKSDASDMGKPDSLRYNVLSWVLKENYDMAIKDLKEYLESPHEYPGYKDKILRFVNHSIDLIYAIRAKRGFSGMDSLTRAKQQELLDKFKGHFKELRDTLKIIEKIQGDMRIEDVRSTMYVVQALSYSVAAIFITAFVVDVVQGLFHTSMSVSSDALGDLAHFVAEKMGF